MKWAFVDYENTGSLEGLKSSDYERIFVFCGPKNRSMKFGSIPSNGFCRIELLSIGTSGPNNLDFHLAFHLGRFHESAPKDVEFHIISSDNGFNGLVNHLKKMGRNCTRLAIHPHLPEPAQRQDLSATAELIVAHLKDIDGRTRPRTKPKLLNWIKAHCNSLQNPLSPEKVCAELQHAKLIQVSGADISYKIAR